MADATVYGGRARYINHSCNPNCYTKVFYVEGVARMGIYAKRDLELGEELCYDYMVRDLTMNQRACCLLMRNGHWQPTTAAAFVALHVPGVLDAVVPLCRLPDTALPACLLCVCMCVYCSLSLRRGTAACPAAVVLPTAGGS